MVWSGACVELVNLWRPRRPVNSIASSNMATSTTTAGRTVTTAVAAAATAAATAAAVRPDLHSVTH